MNVPVTRALTLVVAALAGSLCHAAAAPASLPSNRDLNGDGLSDLVLDLYAGDADTFVPWVVFGKPGAASVDRGAIGTAGFRVTGECSTATAAGDVDGDGLGEIATSCMRPGRVTAEVTVVSSRAASGELDPFEPAQPALHISGADLRHVAPVGDVNGDGKAELVVSGSYRRHHQSAYLVLGRAFPARVDVRSLGAAGVVLRGPHHRFSSDADSLTVAGAGDMDGDGLGDVVIGDGSYPDRSCRFGADCAGRAWVLFGAAQLPPRFSLPRLRGRGFAIRPRRGQKVAGVGQDVSSAGDLDGDRHDDLLVAADVGGDRSPFVVWGAPGRRTRPRVLSRHSSRLRARRGSELYATALGDVSGDGRDDLAVNDPDLGPSLNVVFGQRWRGALRAGRARPPGVRALVPVPGGMLLTEQAGDVNGDQIPDVVVREAQSSEESYSERVFVVFGRRPLQPVSLGALGDSGFEIR
jgi:glycosylphosphatidylinositol phospholipase D